MTVDNLIETLAQDLQSRFARSRRLAHVLGHPGGGGVDRDGGESYCCWASGMT